MTGSALSQFATAASGLPKTIGEQMSAVRAQEQKLKLAAYQGAQAKRAAAIERATKTVELGPGAVLKGRDPNDPSKFITIAKGEDKWRKPDLYYHELSNGEFTPHFNINDKTGSEEALAAYRDKTGNTKAKIVNTFKVGTRPSPKTVTPQMGYAKITLGNGDVLKTPSFNVIPTGARDKAVKTFIDQRKKQYPDKDFRIAKVETFKLGTESDAGVGKLTLSQLRGLSTNPDLMDQYAGNSLVKNYFAADTSGKKLIREQNAQYELSLLQQVSPYVDKDSGKTLPATGLSQEGEAALRNRLRLLDELDKKDANYERDKKLLTVSSRLKAHIDRLDDASLAEVELDTMSRELRDLIEGAPSPVVEGQPPSDKKDVNKFLSRFDFTDISGGFPGWVNKLLNKVGAVAQLDLQADAAAASGVLKDMYQRTTRILLGINEVNSTRETKRSYEAIEELNPVPQGITVTRESLMRRAGEIRATLEDSLADTLRRGRLASQQNDPKTVLTSLDEAKSVRRLLYSWAYVESSLRGGARYSVVTKQGRKNVRALFGKKAP